MLARILISDDMMNPDLCLFSYFLKKTISGLKLITSQQEFSTYQGVSMISPINLSVCGYSKKALIDSSRSMITQLDRPQSGPKAVKIKTN